MYHSTRSECLVLIKSTMVCSARATNSPYHSALDQQHRTDMLQVPARILGSR